MTIKNVLLIDDDEDSNFLNSWVIKKIITGEIVVKPSAVHALKYLSEIASDPLRVPEIIFLDLRMPVMDGFEFLNQFKLLPSAVIEYCKIIILTSSFDRADYNRAISDPCVIGFINKPLTTEALLNLSESKKATV
jgi:CheY-like chemotaxis protein